MSPTEPDRRSQQPADFSGRPPVVLLPRGHGRRPQPSSGAALVRSVLLLASLAVGALAGYVDVISTGITTTAAILLIGGFLAALARPANAWLYALLMALAVPAMHLLAPSLGLAEARPIHPNVAATLLAIVPALIGGLLGIFVHRALFGAPQGRRR